MVVEYEYTPYGALLSTTGSMASTIGAINPIRYRGYYYDTETELYYLITRYYDPEVGRFLNADVYVSTGQGIIGNNMFAYCNNAPSNMIDADGRDPVPMWAKRIINDEGTEEDYQKALSVDPSAWVGFARSQIDKAIAIAKSKQSTSNNSLLGGPKEFALYDSDRFDDYTPFIETIFSGAFSSPSFNLADDSIGLGTIEMDVTTGGWKWEYGSLKVLNFGHAEAGLEVRDGKITAGALASVWSPDASFSVFGVEITISAEICSVGAGFNKKSSGFGLSFSWGTGISLDFSW